MTLSKLEEPIPREQKPPILFEEFFELGLDESISPFLEPSSRKWSENLSLKASIFSAILLLLAFFLSLYPLTSALSKIPLILVFLIVGIPPLIESFEDLFNLEINIDILMTLAAFSSILIGNELEGALLLVLFSISHAMEDAVTTKAKNAINSLTKLSPTTAFVIEQNENLIEKSVKDIEPGTKILIKSGMIVPLDGKVVSGSSSLNLVHLTGENTPVRKVPGDQVPSGGKNLEGALILEVTHPNSESTLTKIIKLVTEAQEARPRLQIWFNKLSSIYATTIILLAAFFSITLPFFLDIPYFSIEGSVYRALAFLIAASPCALIIAIPIAYLSAISVCAKNGILLKGGVTLDALASCKVFAFDKTGTLTTGVLKCKSIDPLNNTSINFEEYVLPIAYALERNAIHPTAEAIVKYVEEVNIPIGNIKNFKAIPGFGLEAIAIIQDNEFYCAIGHVDFICEKISSDQANALKYFTKEIQDAGDIVSALLIKNEVYIFHFEDTPRSKAAEVLSSLRLNRKMRLLMLTGDHYESAKKIANEMQIDEFYANLKPEDKLEYVTKISQTERLTMVGDGINDAPALARATVGISMGKVGNTAAVEASDVILLQDNIEKLDWLVQKAQQTRAIVKQNLTIAAAAIAIASLPALAGFIPIWVAVVLHEGGTVLVGLNALRLLRK